jgi:hypothetical protein
MPVTINGTTGIVTPAENTSALTVGSITGILKATSGVVSQAIAGTDYLTSTSGGAITLATEQTASGTAVDFTGIPSWAKRITVMFDGVSTSGTSPYLIRVGTSSSIITSGYNSYCNTFNSGPTGSTSTVGFLILELIDSITTLYGNLTITKMSNDTWVSSGTLGNVGSIGISLFGGGVTFAGTLDRIRLTTANGTDAFDAGTINISYE